MARTRRMWTESELAHLVDRYPNQRTDELALSLSRTIRQVYSKATALGLKKSPEFLASDQSGRLKPGQTRPHMIATQFKAGQKPWNKGKHYTAGGRSVETRFKKGERHGQANRNYVPIGSLRVTVDGILERKVNDTHPVPARRWVSVARLVWEAARGPIPKGHVVVFKPGMRTTDERQLTIDRLECISRAELAGRNHWSHRYPKEMGKLFQLKGAIARQVNRLAKEQDK